LKKADFVHFNTSIPLLSMAKKKPSRS